MARSPIVVGDDGTTYEEEFDRVDAGVCRLYDATMVVGGGIVEVAGECVDQR